MNYNINLNEYKPFCSWYPSGYSVCRNRNKIGKLKIKKNLQVRFGELNLELWDNFIQLGNKAKISLGIAHSPECFCV